MPQNGPAPVTIDQNRQQNDNRRQVAGLRTFRGRETHNGSDGRTPNKRGHTFGRIGTTMCASCRNAGQKCEYTTESGQCERCRKAGKACGPKKLPRDQPSERKPTRQANRSSSAVPSVSQFDLEKPLLDQLLPHIPENSMIEFAKKLLPELQSVLEEHKPNLSDEDRMSEEMDELTLNEHSPSLSAIFQETDRGPYFGSEVPYASGYDNQLTLNPLNTNTSALTPLAVPENNGNTGPSLVQGPIIHPPRQAPPARYGPIVHQEVPSSTPRPIPSSSQDCVEVYRDQMQDNSAPSNTPDLFDNIYAYLNFN